MHVFRLDKPFSAVRSGRTIALPPLTASPRKGPHDPTERSHVRRLLLPPSRPLRHDPGAPLSHLPRGDAHPPASSTTPPRPARGLRRGGRVANGRAAKGRT